MNEEDKMAEETTQETKEPQKPQKTDSNENNTEEKKIKVVDRNKSYTKKPFLRKKYCRFCKGELSEINYKNVDMITRFTKSKGKILPRRLTGNCMKHQRQLAKAIKRARYMALLPYVSE